MVEANETIAWRLSKDLQDKVDDFLENRQPRSLGGQSTSGRHMKDTE